MNNYTVLCINMLYFKKVIKRADFAVLGARKKSTKTLYKYKKFIV